MFRRKHEVGDNPLSQPISIEVISEPVPLTESDMLEFLGQLISEREKYISEQQEQIYSEQKDVDAEVPETNEENQPEVMSTANARISQISNANQYISQLNRMERSLKGFPPSVLDNNKNDKKTTFEEEKPVVNENGDSVVTSKTGGKKITFD
ncbi:DNA-directed RNA polymerase I subunit HuRPA14 [Hanseniaspora uvarum DSM 2768]|jgi:hypothetical protein|nr:DNA-directed RNA polymerase I subunit HuRPA14 [Hanseniaspora uvarum DSM 2768]